MDFVQDIIIPSYALQTPSYLYVLQQCESPEVLDNAVVLMFLPLCPINDRICSDTAERLWVWKYSEGQGGPFSFTSRPR